VRPVAHGLIEPSRGVGHRFPRDLDLWHVLPALANSEFQAETEKVKPVADVSDAGLFHREFYAALAAQEFSNLITQPLCISLGAPCDEHAPVVRIAHESDIRALVVMAPQDYWAGYVEHPKSGQWWPILSNLAAEIDTLLGLETLFLALQNATFRMGSKGQNPQLTGDCTLVGVAELIGG